MYENNYSKVNQNLNSLKNVHSIGIRFSKAKMYGNKMIPGKLFDSKIIIGIPNSQFSYTKDLFNTIINILANYHYFDKTSVRRNFVIKLYSIKIVSNGPYIKRLFTKIKYRTGIIDLNESDGEYLYNCIKYISDKFKSDVTIMYWK